MIGEVLDIMVTLANEGMTMLCVTHEMGFARKVADQVIFMDGYEIIEENDPDEFFTNPGSERTKTFLDQVLSHQSGSAPALQSTEPVFQEHRCRRAPSWGRGAAGLVSWA